MESNGGNGWGEKGEGGWERRRGVGKEGVIKGKGVGKEGVGKEGEERTDGNEVGKEKGEEGGREHISVMYNTSLLYNLK